MYRLLLDSSDTALSVGISLEDKIIYRHFEYAWQRQSEYMIPAIKNALNELSITLKDIDEVVVGIGPGSYTGVRIPLTIAKTMNATNNTVVKAISSLAMLGNTNEKYISLMNARGGRSYIGIYDNGVALLKDTIIENNKLDSLINEHLEKGFVLKGNLAYLKKDIIVDDKLLDGMLSYALISEKVENVDSLCPIYLKD